MRAASTLVIMARYPTPGAVKTRLAQVIGAARAAALYRAFLQDLEARCGAGPRPLVWAYTPADSNFAALLMPGARCLPQDGADLGARMHNCFTRLCADSGRGVIMIGADVPHVRDAWLDEAERALASADVVLGPAADGGYYLITMRAAHDVFSGIAMGTSRVLAETRRAAESAGLRVHLLPASFDVDDADDLQRLRDLLEDANEARRLPATAALLARWDGDDHTRP